jgi:hypothetical protein
VCGVECHACGVVACFSNIPYVGALGPGVSFEINDFCFGPTIRLVLSQLAYLPYSGILPYHTTNTRRERKQLYNVDAFEMEV